MKGEGRSFNSLALRTGKGRGRLLVSLHIDYTIGVFNNKDSPSGCEQCDGGHMFK